MKSRIVYALLLLIFIGVGQSIAVPVWAQDSVPVAEKVAEFSDESYEMYCAFLHEFTDRLKQNNALRGVIIVYGPEGNLDGSALGLLRHEVGYIKGGLGYRSDSLITIIGGSSNRAPWTTTELWVVPPGAKIPEPVKRPGTTADFSGKVGHEVGTLDGGNDSGDSPSSYGVPMAAFAQILRQQPDSVGYLVTHAMAEDDQENWRGYVDYRIKILKTYGVDPARIKIVHGKPTEYPKDDLWILPKGEHLPPEN